MTGLLPLYIASGILTIGEGSLLVLISPYLAMRGFPEGAIGAIVSIYGVAALLARIPAGAAYRSRWLAHQVGGGCVAMAVAFALIPLTAHPLALGALVGLDGIGFAVATTGAMAGLIERRPRDSSAGPIMGWYTGSVGAGYAIAGFVAGSLADAIGVGDALFVMALVPLGAGAALSWVFRRNAAPPAAAPAPRGFRDAIGDFTRASSAVWLAFAVSLFINLTSGVTFTFFPLYGLAIGLTLTQIGVLTGIHGAVAAAVRFGSGIFFRWISYRRSLGVMVFLSGIAIASLASTRLFLVLGAAWALIGLARGVLRVASGALVMDSAGATDGQRGTASSIYLAGLDLGKILGPLLGGLSAEWLGLRATFVVIGIAFPLVYWVLARLIGPRHAAPSAPDGDREVADEIPDDNVLSLGRR